MWQFRTIANHTVLCNLIHLWPGHGMLTVARCMQEYNNISFPILGPQTRICRAAQRVVLSFLSFMYDIISGKCNITKNIVMVTNLRSMTH